VAFGTASADTRYYINILRGYLPSYRWSADRMLWLGAIPWPQFLGNPPGRTLVTINDGNHPGAIIYDFLRNQDVETVEVLVQTLQYLLVGGLSAQIVSEFLTWSAARVSAWVLAGRVAQTTLSGLGETVAVATFDAEEGGD
jgi:hypothetical protein